MTTRSFRAALLAGLLAGCTDGTKTPGLTETDAVYEPEVAVISELWFARATDGVSEGFDLDGVTSSLGGGNGCGVADLTAPDGTPGIDNAFSALLPAIEAVGAEALEPLIQMAIDSGELLLMLEVEGQRDPAAECVSVTISRGAGEATAGGLGRLVPGQTFDRSTQVPPSQVACAEVGDDLIVSSPHTIPLPLTVFDESIDLNLVEGAIRMEREPDGSLSGVVSGGLSIEELQDNLFALDGVDSDIISLANNALSVLADLSPDESGACTQLSVAMQFKTVSAFFFDE
jgi:hypothetical protein